MPFIPVSNQVLSIEIDTSLNQSRAFDVIIIRMLIDGRVWIGRWEGAMMTVTRDMWATKIKMDFAT
jgi:hypothetical protein